MRHGIVVHLDRIRTDLLAWLDQREYDSIRPMQGSMSLRTAANPAAFERGNYLQVLRSFDRRRG
jgi:dihydroorotate dehydrogenase (fumarate)